MGLDELNNLEEGLDLRLEEELCRVLHSILSIYGNYCADLALMSEEEIAELNGEYRQINKPTDVLSFPSLQVTAGELPNPASYPHDVLNGKLMLGSIALCPKIIQQNATELGHSVSREYGYMLVHSVLHLLGYDHLNVTDKKAMRAEEERVCRLIKLEERE